MTEVVGTDTVIGMVAGGAAEGEVDEAGSSAVPAEGGVPASALPGAVSSGSTPGLAGMLTRSGLSVCGGALGG